MARDYNYSGLELDEMEAKREEREFKKVKKAMKKYNTCDYCKIEFKCHEDLIKHAWKKHPEIMPPVEEGK